MGSPEVQCFYRKQVTSKVLVVEDSLQEKQQLLVFEEVVG